MCVLCRWVVYIPKIPKLLLFTFVLIDELVGTFDLEIMKTF